jgi:hypothetical protein
MNRALIDTAATIDEDVDGLLVRHEQHIPEDFLQRLEDERFASSFMRAGEMHKVCEIPVFVYELWMRQGRDPWRASAKQLVKWLQEDNLEAFLATSKSV